MKIKRLINVTLFFILLILVVGFFVLIFFGQFFGFTEFSPFNATLTLIDIPPSVTINFPEDGAFYTPDDLALNFNVSLSENGTAIYSLDDGVNNVSMTGDGGGIFGNEFNATNDSIADAIYVFQVYANDTIGNNNYTESVAFVFNSTITTPPSPPPSGNGGGGISGGGGSPVVNFSVDKDLLEVQIIQGGAKKETIFITNTGERILLFNLNIIQLASFASLSNDSFRLLLGESKEIDIDFSVDEDEPVAVHTGSVLVTARQLSKSVDIILQILDKGVLFDLKSVLADDILNKNQKIDATITITDISNLGKVDVLLEYFIKDFSDNEIKLAEEILEIDGELEIERRFSLPQDLELGNNVFFVKLTYEESVATSANAFKLIDVSFIFWIWIVLLILLILIILFLIFYRRRGEDIKILNVLNDYGKTSTSKVSSFSGIPISRTNSLLSKLFKEKKVKKIARSFTTYITHWEITQIGKRVLVEKG